MEEKQVLHGPLCDPKSLCTHTSCRASLSDLQQCTLCYGFFSCSRIHPVGKNYIAKPLFSHWAALSLGDFPSTPWTCLSFQNQKALIESFQNWPLSIHNNQDPERPKGVGLREKIKQSQLPGSPGNPCCPWRTLPVSCLLCLLMKSFLGQTA